jgi:hypothetical protein
MHDPSFETFLTSLGLNGLCQKRCHILVKNWIVDDPSNKKMTSIGSFGASDDQIIRIRYFLRPREVKKVSNDGSGINVHYSGSH